MKSRQIICKTHEVKAIVAGQQSQLRRLVKLQPERVDGLWQWIGKGTQIYAGKNLQWLCERLISQCPYGVVGDRLRVKNERFELEITDIRVERVQDISEADAIAEGSYLTRCSCASMQAKPRSAIDALFRLTHCHIHGEEYSHLWEKLNGKKYPWSSNPWVWVVEFKRIEVQP